MGKSNKKSNVKVAAVAPTIPLVQGKKGKRQPEAEVEIQPLQKKLKSATKVPQKKKHEPSSSEEASESEEEVKLPVSKKPNLAKKIPAKISSSEEEDSSDEEPATKLVAAAKKAPKLAKNGLVSAQRNGKAESSDDSDSDSEEEKVKKPLQSKGAGKIGFFKGKPMEGSSDDDDSEDEPSDEGSDSEESEEEKTVQKVKKNQQPAKIVEEESDEEDSSDESDDEPKVKQQSVQVKKNQQPAKILKNESTEEDSSDESDDEPKAKQQRVQASKAQQTPKATEEESESEDVSDDSEDDDLNESDDEPKKQNVKAFTPKTPKTPVTPGSKTLFVGNLPFSIDADSIIEFFQDAGEVADVRLAARDDGSSRGYGHVEFVTEEAASKAMSKNGQDLLGRAVRLDFATERGAPGSKPDFKSRNDQDQKSGCTVFVRGFDKNQEEDDIRNSLTEHFEDCGSIENIRIPKDYDSGVFKGFAYIEFKDSASLSKALELGTDELSVEEAMARSGGRDGSGRRGGRGGGRGFGDRGGRFSGGRGRGGGRGTPRGRGRGDHSGGGRGRFNMGSSGKKTTFGDD